MGFLSGMKWYHYLFLALKIAISIQFILIIANKQSITSKEYLYTEIIFKSGLFLFIQYYLFTHELPEIPVEDKVIISFAGALLLYDAWVNDFRLLLKEYGIHHLPEVSDLIYLVIKK